jgi:hypothetical protein
VSALRDLLALLAAHGPTLLMGVSIVLAIGAVAMLCASRPATRRRIGLSTALGCAFYLIVAAVPLPRLELPHAAPAAVSPPASAAVSPPTASPELPAHPAPVRGTPDAAMDGDVRGELLRAFAPVPSAAPPAAPAAAPPPASLPWPLLAAGLYAAGAVLMLLRSLSGFVRLRRLLHTSTPPPPALAEAAPPNARLRIARSPVRPFCAGIVRPTIVLPPALARPARREEALAVLRHESAHVHHGDPGAQTLLALLGVLLFFHPLFWWLFREVRFSSELLADDAAARTDRTGYARALMNLVQSDEPAPAVAGTVAVFHRPSEFYRRIQMLLQTTGTLSAPVTRRRRAAQALCALAFGGAVSALLGVPLPSQDPPPTGTPKVSRMRLATPDGGEKVLEGGPPSALFVRSSLPQDPQGRAARKQAAELEATIEDLRAEVARLRAQLAELEAGVDPRDPQRANADINRRVVELIELDRKNAQNPPEAHTDVHRRAIIELLKAREHAADEAARRQAEVVLLERAAAPVATDAQPVPSTAPPARHAAAHGHDTSGIDGVAQLVSHVIDLQAQIQLAEPEVERTAQMAAHGLVPEQEARGARVQLEALQKKLGIGMRLVDGEIKATQREIAYLQQPGADETAGQRAHREIQVERARMRLEALQAVK